MCGWPAAVVKYFLSPWIILRSIVNMQRKHMEKKSSWFRWLFLPVRLFVSPYLFSDSHIVHPAMRWHLIIYAYVQVITKFSGQRLVCYKSKVGFLVLVMTKWTESDMTKQTNTLNI